MGDLEEVVVVGLPTLKLHHRRPQEEPDDAPAAMPFGKTAPLFGPKTPSPPPFNPDFDGDGDSDVSHDPIRKEDKPKDIEVPDALEGDIPPPNDDSGSGNDDSGTGDDNGGQTSSSIPDATEIDLPPANAPPTSTTETPEETPPPPPPPSEETTTPLPELNERTTTSQSRSERTTSSSGPRETYPSDTQPAEANESSTSHSWTQTQITTTTDMTESPTTTSCITITHCSTNTLYPYETTCYYETTLPFAIEKDLENESKDIGNILKDTGKLVAVILVTMAVTILLTVGCILARKRRARKRRVQQGRERIGGDVEGGTRKRRKFWAVLGKKNGHVGSEKAVAVRAGNSTAAEQAEVPVPPEMTQRNQRLSIILPPGQIGHRHRMSNNTILDRTLSVASSLTVPPYPGSLAASGTTRSNSTRTARSVSSNITDDTVVRTKREYQSTVNRLAEENMHSDHAVVADGFHLAPPNPFEEEVPGVAGSNGMGGSGVGIGGMGAVDGAGNRRVNIRPPPPVIRVGDDMNPFEDPDMDLDMGVADGFRPNGGGRMIHRGSGMRHPPPPPPMLEDPFEDGLGGYQDMDVGMGDGFQGYVPGQMGDIGDENAAPVQRRVSMRGGDARRRVSGDGISIVSSTSGESLSSNETLRGDLEDWNHAGGGGGCGGSGGHAGHGHGGTRRI